MKSPLVKVVICLFILPFIFLLLDFLLTHTLLRSSEQEYRISNNTYHHALAENFQGYGVWGSIQYEICTGRYGNKVSCSDGSQSENGSNNFDIVFIGDSFVEGIGLPYEDTFVGLTDHALPETSVLNLAVSSYSPSIYLAKIKDLWEAGLRFQHLIAFVDISDTQDEALYYELTDDGRVIDRAGPTVGVLAAIKRFLLSGDFTVPVALYNLLTPPHSSQSPDNVFSLERSAWTYDRASSGYGEMGVEGANAIAYDRMDTLYQFLNENGVEFSIGVLPWPAQLSHITQPSTHEILWQEFCQTRCSRFINVYQRFRAELSFSTATELYDNFYITGDVHLNRDGNVLVFEEIMTELSHGSK